MTVAVSCRNLSKQFQSVKALSDFSLDIQSGEMVCVIGADGAGKTTLFRIFATLLIPDTGSLFIQGLNAFTDYQAIRSIIGYMPSQFSLYQDLTVQENLQVFASIFNTSVKAKTDLIYPIYRFLAPFSGRKAGALSGGMKQKLALCVTLIHQPSILFLDEPTTGVDPVSREEFWIILRHLQDHGMTIVLTTPYLDEAAQADRIVLMQQGQLLVTDSPNQMIHRADLAVWSLFGGDMFKLLQAAQAYDRVQSCFAFGDSHHITFKQPSADISAFINYLADCGLGDVQIHPVTPTIEDYFLLISSGAIKP